MKTVFLLAAILCSTFSFAQRLEVTTSLVVGNDLQTILSSIGAEIGVAGKNRKHWVSLTLETQELSNNRLQAYGLQDRIFPELASGRASYDVGLRYVFRVTKYAPVHFSAVVNPFYSVNMEALSAYVGARASFLHKGETMAAQVDYDVVWRRCVMRLVFTPRFKNRSTVVL